MRKLITTAFMLCALSIFGFAQTAPKTDASLEAAMQKFKNSIVNKNPTVFLSFISPTKGLTIMNTIDQGDAGNADKPAFDSKIEYKILAADFKKKGDNYRDIFVKSQDSPSFYDNFATRKGNWKLDADNKFMPVDATDKMPVKAIYVKWEKEGGRWFAVEVGRPIS